eukprot:CAMPEP_0184310756 /NCGR_PEP_ID=MMETSP1049-20130417/34579_1 /TAXON_ID=77928 /ORGANISM="Proteomonas sulcata, Strain CCMP704" /LENGTH=97 /DNA_ID=CAMNT_0026625365 /DNA_START=1012 /DNA_END=1305 /DNA_ORIENTATION=-
MQRKLHMTGARRVGEDAGEGASSSARHRVLQAHVTGGLVGAFSDVSGAGGETEARGLEGDWKPVGERGVGSFAGLGGSGEASEEGIRILRQPAHSPV